MKYFRSRSSFSFTVLLSAVFAVASVAQAQVLSPGDIVTLPEPGLPHCSEDPLVLSVCLFDPETEEFEVLVSTAWPPNTSLDDYNLHHFELETKFHPERHRIFLPTRRFIPNVINTGQLLEIDVVTGSSSVLIEDDRLLGTAGLALESDGNLIIAAGAAGYPNPLGAAVILRFDRDEETLSVLSQGGLLTDVSGQPLVLEDGSILVAGPNAIIQVDPESGSQSVFWNTSQRTTSIDQAPNGDFYVGGFGRLTRLDGATLQPTTLFNGYGFEWVDIDVDADGTLNLVMDVFPVLLRWNPATEPLPPTPIIYAASGFARSVEVVDPECSDGIDNDGDGSTDLDDENCASPNDNREMFDRCGLGFELALMLPLVGLARRSGLRARRKRGGR